MKAEKETLVLGVGNLLLTRYQGFRKREAPGSRPFDGRGHGRASFIKLAARI